MSRKRLTESEKKISAAARLEYMRQYSRELRVIQKTFNTPDRISPHVAFRKDADYE